MHRGKIKHRKLNDHPFLCDIFEDDLLKEILVANKGSESGTLYINQNGLMKLTFSNKELQSTYYIVAKEQ